MEPGSVKRNTRLSFALIVLALTALFFIHQWRWGEDRGRHCVASDGRGYYAYLPAAFIYHDLHFKFLFETEKKTEAAQFVGDVIVPVEDQRADKYFSGVAFLMSPFFLGTLGITKLTGGEADGYSAIFQGAVCLASLFYFLLGLFFLHKLLILHGISEKSSILTILLIGLGTNLFYYTVMEPSMSHVYSFAMIAAFAFSVKNFFVTGKTRLLSFAAFCLGAIVLIRPPNALILGAIPFLAGNSKILFLRMQELLSKIKVLLVPGIIILAIVSIQPILWHAETGKYFVWSYPGEGFNFFSPQIMNILFSYKKGLFVYTPMIFLSLFGLWTIYRENKFEFFSFLVFFALVTYVLSSWWNWYYGGSFGLRAFIDFYPLFAVPLAFLVTSFQKTWINYFVVCIAFVLVWINYVQSYQYSFNILTWDSMNKEKYWEVFLSTKKKYIGYLTREIIVLDSSTVKNTVVFENNFEGNDSWGHPESITTTQAYSGTHSVTANPHMWYSAGFAKNISDITPAKNVVLHITCEAMLDDLGSDAQLVISFENKGAAYDWRNMFLNEYIEKKNRWEKIRYEGRMPSNRNPDDTLKIYLLNTKHNVYADDFKIEFFEMK